MRPAGHLTAIPPAPAARGHVTPSLVNAYSTRRVERPDGPVLHASNYPPLPYSPSGTAYLARCGAKVRNITRVGWDPHGPGRRCPMCQRLESPAPAP